MQENELEPLELDVERLVSEAQDVEPIQDRERVELWSRISKSVEEARKPSGHGRAWWGLAAAAVVVLTLGVVAWLLGREPLSGRIVASDRVTEALGDRGVAVLEAGAEIRWSVDAHGTASVRQPRGTVFYRVEPGGPFEVHTPSGAVHVVGTSFEVQAGDTTRVTVFEGTVRLESAFGAQTLGPGEVGGLRTAGGPVPMGSRVTSSETAPQVPSSQVASGARPTSRSVHFKAEDPEVEAEDDEVDLKGLYDPTPEQLRELAERCELKWAHPAMDDAVEEFFDEDAERLELTEEERVRVEAIYTDARRSMLQGMRDLYVATTGDTEGAASMSFEAMDSEIRHKALQGEEDEAVRRIARRRASLAVEDVDPTPMELLLMAHVESASSFYAALEDALGPHKALRVAVALPRTVTIASGCP